MAATLLENPLQVALQLHQQGRLAEAERLYRAILQEHPNHPAALHLLGVVAGQVGRIDEALALIRRAIGVAPNEAVFHSNLAMFLTSKGKFDEAIDACRESLRLNPSQADACNNLANALIQKGRWREAIAASRQALAINAELAEAYINLAFASWQTGDLRAAEEAYRAGLKRRPTFAEGHNTLGVVLQLQGRLDEASASFRESLRHRPKFADAAMNLGAVLKDGGQVEEALQWARTATQYDGRHADAQSNLICTMLFHPGSDAAALRGELDRYNRQHAAPLHATQFPHFNDRVANRRLRIGYVSPDLRDHVVGRNLLPLMHQHDRCSFEIFCYADVRHPDAITEEFHRHADCWRPIAGLSDAAVADLIRADLIDILVDLTLHMRSNRLRVFARKPAPVQVTFAGYPGSTGLEAMDYRLSDPHLDPQPLPGERDPADAVSSEKTIRLEHTFWCYDPLDGAPEVNELPARKGGITFGCLNNFCKVNGEGLALWAKVLNAVPGSRLVLLAAEGSHRERTAMELRALGIAAERLAFVPPAPRAAYLRYYHELDISLDTLPYNGHTTSLDSLYMGVPVVTLVGETVVGRAGLSQLTNLGMPELVARTAEAYVGIAVDLARDLTRLEGLRGVLRERMRSSPLMAAGAFARSIECAYRGMWAGWCALPPGSGRSGGGHG